MPPGIKKGCLPSDIPQETNPEISLPTVQSLAVDLRGLQEYRQQLHNNWLQELNRLDDLQLDMAFLPVGCGKSGKGPMDPRGIYKSDGTLVGLSKWESHPGFTIPQLQAVPNILAAGVRTGLSLAAFDWDGETSVDLSCDLGLAPWALDTWHVHRSNDPWRLKALVLLTPDQLAQLPDQGDGSIEFETTIPTRPPNPAIDGDKGDALEFFYSGGRQVNILGNHKSSGGFYCWPEGLGPENLKVLPDEWFRFVLSAAKAKQCIDSSLSPAAPAAKQRHSKSGMKRLDPCPICGRNSRKGNGTWCDQTADGLIFCMKGSTFNAERSHGPFKVGKSKLNGYRLTKETKECFVFAPLKGGRNV